MRLSRIFHLAAVFRVATAIGQEGPTAEDPCGLSSSYFRFMVNTTEDGNLMQDCTVVNHTIWVSKDYPGSLTLPKLTACGGLWIGDAFYDDQTYTPQDGTLTGVSLPVATDVFEILAVDVKNLETLSIPSLINNSDVTLTGLPALKSFDFGPTFSGQYINISNTGLEEFIWSSSEYIYSVELTNNPNLNNVTFTSSSNVSTLEINCNNAPLPRIILPGALYTIEISNCDQPSGDWKTSIQSPPDVIGAWNIHDNLFSSFGVPNLTKIAETRTGYLSNMEITDNNNLTEMSFPSLELVEGFVKIKDNYNYSSIKKTTFPSLKNVSNEFDLDGPIKEFDTPPALTNARIAIDSSSSLNCSLYNAHKPPLYATYPTGPGLWITCTGGAIDYSGGGSSSSDNSNGSPHLSWQATVGIVVPIVWFVICTAILWCLCIRRRNRRRRRKAEIAKLSQQIQELRDAPPPFFVGPVPQESGVTTGGLNSFGVVSPIETARNEQVAHVQNEKPELSSVSSVARVDERRDIRGSVNGMSREEELDARERALVERERQIAELQAKLSAAEMP